MEAIVYLLSKFSAEMLAAQLALISLVCCLSLYFYLNRRRKRYMSEWVPAALVKAYLDKVDQDERDIRLKLFGEESPRSVMPTATGTANSAAPVQQIVVQGADPAVMKELEALRAQLGVADTRSAEFNNTIAQLKAQNAALEEKLKAAPAGAAATATPEMVKELDDLKAKLAEYEVIEDDLANLKKYQIENKALQEKISTYEKGGASASDTAANPVTADTAVPAAPVAPADITTISGSTPAPAEVTVISATPAPAAPALTVVSGGEAELAPAPAAAAPAAPAPAGEVATPAAPAATSETPVAAAPGAADAPKAGKEKEEDLLSEFEKMLAS